MDNTQSLQNCIWRSSCALLVFMCLGKSVQSEEMYSLFSIISLCEFSKPDCAQLENHLKEIILNSFGILDVVPASKQALFKYSLNLWLARTSEKLGPEVITGALELRRGMDILVGGWKLQVYMGLREMIPLVPTGRLMGQWIQCTNDCRSVAMEEGCRESGI